GHHSLGLLNDHAAVEGTVELFVQRLGFQGGAVLKDGDGGNVGEGLGSGDVGWPHVAGGVPEQVDGTDDGTPQTHGQGVHRVEPGGKRFGGESRPPFGGGGEIIIS